MKSHFSQLRTLEQVILSNIVTSNQIKKSSSCTQAQSLKTFSVVDNFLESHGLTKENRERMIDWMIQVFKVFQSGPETFFLGVSLLDRYLKTKSEGCEFIGKDQLYLVGLGVIFISSKYQDVYPIRLEGLREKAGHYLYSKEDILKIEKDILLTLEFKIEERETSIY